MAVKIVEESAVLTLDFWEEEVIYCGKSFPTGSLACDALNIPGEVITQMETLCKKLNQFMGTFNSGKGDAALLPEARLNAMKLMNSMIQYKPFSYIRREHLQTMITKAFSPEGVKVANALIQVQRTGKLTDQLADKYTDGVLLSRLLPVLAHLGFSLKAFHETMLPFAEKLHEAEQRLDITYAEIFNAYFPKEPTFEDAGGWMSMTNVTQQYLTIFHPEKQQPLLVKRMHYVSFVGMLRSDFFEGLRFGNAPKRCLNCGRWFLTTNGYLVKYCNGLAPNDPQGRTCRSVGAKLGGGNKENPEGHPIKRIYETRRNTISKCVHRGTMSRELADMVMKIAEEKRTKAFLNNTYFQNDYEKEMQQEAIVAEAEERLNRDGGDEQVTDNYTWDMDGFIQKVGYAVNGMQITQYIAENIFQLDPPPPELSENCTANDYIRMVLETHDLKYFSYFLHRFEPSLNRYIRRTLASEANFQYDPEGFLEIKLCCMMTMLHLLPRYELEKKAAFTTYAHNFVYNTIRDYQMHRESWSLPSVSTYKKIRTAAWMQNNLENALEAFMKKYQCSEETADRYFREAKCLHSRKSLYITDEEGDDGGDVMEEVADEEDSDMLEIFWNGIHANAVRTAFDRLTPNEKEYLQRRNAACMKCGCVRHMSTAESFDDLGAHFELTTANGAEKAYRKAVDHLTRLLVEDNAIGTVTIKRKKVIRRKKKTAAAVYEYQADYDGEWGEIVIDFENGTGKISYIAELDTTRSHRYASKAIEEILNSDLNDLPKRKTIAFPK